ncbi:putative ATPase N2B [Erysiphe neolycopersici]|uniref:Putative ATPase N2B n=1 Tax=Erysiphe neolycopersici TaxID=212602 RepID=A0A420HKK6_9PEZI|nr:putative ATPase N2B [Erysiphe neolycopersici]
MPATISTSSVPVLTNPLNLYRSLLSTKYIDPDPSQHRLAIHLQKVYLRLIDYSPRLDFGNRLKTISQICEKPYSKDDGKQLAVPSHPIWRNPIFSHLFSRKAQSNSLALTRVLTDYEEAINLQSPQGLLVHGEVGSGKSMLVDLLADGLPNRKKKKWHFNAFMLETLAKLEQLRRSRSQENYKNDNSEHSLLWLAKDMIDKSPILFLDEFQLPDRATSKIISQLLTVFFQLGGVLIATSNRMPDELLKSSGVDFITPPINRPMNGLLGLGRESQASTYRINNEYAGFVEVLKARCEIWNMEGQRDWRRREAEELVHKASKTVVNANENIGCHTQSSTSLNSRSDTIKDSSSILPQNFFLKSSISEVDWQSVLKATLLCDSHPPDIWRPETLTVYARDVIVARQSKGITYWKFAELCEGPLGPADYITLASKYHTFILDEIPIMTLVQKNEARRLITLLDALYEARCKLIVRAEVGPDSLFFPELSTPLQSSIIVAEKNIRPTIEDDRDSVYSETISEIYQDKTLNFRPNISPYTEDSQPDPYRSKIASDIEKIQSKHQVDFTKTSSFTGEDEHFAYKRARSRLWEMCGAKWHSRSNSDWWRPLPIEARTWEYSATSRPNNRRQKPSSTNDIKMGGSQELDKPAGLQGQSFEQKESPINISCQCTSK